MYHILVVGQSGSGKSSVANTIVGERRFKVSSMGYSKDYQPETDEATFEGVKLKVMDGPDVGTVTRTEQELEAAMIKLGQDLDKVGKEWKHGIDILVYVLKFGSRFTEEQEEGLKYLKVMLGEDFLSKRCIIVVSRGDIFLEAMEDEGTPDKTFQQWCQESSGLLRDFMKQTKMRCVLFNNRSRDELKIQSQRVDFVKALKSAQVSESRPVHPQKDLKVQPQHDDSPDELSSTQVSHSEQLAHNQSPQADLKAQVRRTDFPNESKLVQGPESLHMAPHKDFAFHPQYADTRTTLNPVQVSDSPQGACQSPPENLEGQHQGAHFGEELLASQHNEHESGREKSEGWIEFIVRVTKAAGNKFRGLFRR